MAHIIIARHAKTIDRSEADEDFDRYLTERGHADAERLAEALAQTGLKADLALVSPARRTQETWAHLASTLGDPRVESPMALYHASTSMLIRASLEAFEAGAQTLAVIGHNPGVGGFAHELAARAGTLSRWPHGFATSSAAVFDLLDDVNSMNTVHQVLNYNPKA
ncbi:SixA phosphatase family protein [Marinicauda sp. Alg238-R41]|uniref:SixA phosphatase family protein n=1 Tax=Marinicauda sp. Alg238-R41 TaxID=2993447 RepID=UPI0022E69615|nr:histidine phosphatase family protein [Marinicauda sp. Alg238-R41]